MKLRWNQRVLEDSRRHRLHVVDVGKLVRWQRTDTVSTERPTGVLGVAHNVMEVCGDGWATLARASEERRLKSVTWKDFARTAWIRAASLGRLNF